MPFTGETMRLYTFAFAAVLFVTLDSHAQVEGRGQLLHDKHCLSCHATRIYTREDRKAAKWEQVREQVDRWQKNVSLGWKDAEIDLVTEYLARRFYHIECPSKC